jgi:hypothetical protein
MLFALCLVSGPFGDSFSKGVLAADRVRGLNQLRLPTRIGIGTWSTGTQKIAVEHAFAVTPSTASFLIGFSRARLGWSDAEVESRWKRWHAEQQGAVPIVVSLAAYPKSDLLETDPTKAYPSQDDLMNVRFLVEQHGSSQKVEGRMVHHAADYDRRDVERRTSYNTIPELSQLLQDDRFVSAEESVRLGPYRRTTYWIQATGIDLSKPFSLRILTQNKVRRATFEPG